MPDTAAITITVNGESRRIDVGATVLDLLNVLNLNPGATVVQRNDDILPRDAYGQTALADGDTLELVRFVGGG